MLKASRKKSALVEAFLHGNIPLRIGASIEVEFRGPQTWRLKGPCPNELGVLFVRCAVIRISVSFKSMQYLSQGTIASLASSATPTIMRLNSPADLTDAFLVNLTPVLISPNK